MKFEKYPSLTRSNDISKGRLRQHMEHADEQWYATEKIHGANFAIYYDGMDFKFAKRTNFIQEEEQFFRWEEYFTEDMKNMWLRVIDDMWEDLDYRDVIVFGEFFGGEIQDDVQYEQTISGNKEFRVFNVFVKQTNQHYVVMGYDLMKKYIGEHRMAPLIAQGKLFELLTTLDLEADSTFGGISEGYVLQQYKDREWKTGDNFLAIKHKTQHFTEVTPAKMHALIGRAAK